ARMEVRFLGEKIVILCSGAKQNLFFRRLENLTGMRKSETVGCAFFCLLCFAQAKKSRSPF
ncbi:hypothetical protein, partial [Avibacterium endocarditidis]|uniref:hypothetical protein n=1 Tax=Avibacterium endocarditidis TaxID=380674 RepID=UPI001CA4E29C